MSYKSATYAVVHVSGTLGVLVAAVPTLTVVVAEVSKLGVVEVASAIVVVASLEALWALVAGVEVPATSTVEVAVGSVLVAVSAAIVVAVPTTSRTATTVAMSGPLDEVKWSSVIPHSVSFASKTTVQNVDSEWIRRSTADESHAIVSAHLHFMKEGPNTPTDARFDKINKQLFAVIGPRTRAIFVFVIAFGYFAALSPAFASTPPPSILTPAVFTEQLSTPKVSGETGALTQAISLDIPPGRNGLQPDLSLNYNSQDTDQDSIVGYGWTLSIPYIERLNKTGSENLYVTNPYFTSSLDGELASTSPSTSELASSTLANSLVSYWKFDESSGNPQDSVGSNNLTNNGTSTFASGLINNAISLNGSTQYASIADTSSLDPTSALTACAWADPTSVSNTMAVFTKSYGTGWSNPYTSYMVRIDHAPNTIEADLAQGSVLKDVNYSYSPSANTWYFLCEVYDGSDLYLYLNGSDVASTTVSGSVGYNGGPLNIGLDTAGADYFQGKIDEMGLWSRALSPSEISQLYNGGSGLQPPFSTTTVLSSTSTTYAARVDDGSHRLYSYATSTDSWTMYDKQGDEYVFGASAQSKESATTSQTGTVQTYKWLLEKEIDPNGNYIRYAYSKDHNQLYPSEIVYSGHNGTDGPFAITFASTTRADDTINLLPGFEVDTDYLISQITVAISSTTVRQYNLSYTPGNNGYRSLLSSVQESGWNSSGAETTLPPWTFGYVSSTTPFVTSYGGTSNCGYEGDSYVPTATGGDGLDHPVTFTQGVSGVTANIVGVGSYSGPSANAFWSAGNSTCPAETGTRFVDARGNGKAGLVQNEFNYSTGSSTEFGYYANTSSGGSYAWTATTTYSGVIPQLYVLGSGTGAAGSTGIFGNVDGTELPSYEQDLSISGVTGVNNGAYLANGSAWKSATTTLFSPAESFPSSGADCTDSQLVDVNHDGLDDWVWTDGSKTYVDLNTGVGWGAPDPRWTIPTSTVYESGGNCYDRGFRFVDPNGDGLPDLVQEYTNSGNTTLQSGSYHVVYLNTAHGWATSTAYSLPNIVSAATGTNATYDDLANFMGNGQQEQDVLSTSTNPKGGITSATYGYTTQLGANPNLPYNLLVVTKIVNDDGRGNKQETDYTYSGGLQYLPSNVYDRKFAGFAAVTASTSVASTTTYYSQGSTTTAPIAGDQSDGYGQLNHPFRQDTATPFGTLVQSIFYQYNPIIHGNSEFVGLTRQLEQDYASDGTHLDKDTDNTYSSTTDDLVESIDYGQVNGNSDGTFSTSTASTPRTTVVSYAASSSINLSVPIERTLFNQNNATSSDTKYLYDNLSFGQVNLGNATEEEDWTSGTHFASSTRAYNSFGLVATSTDRDGNATTYAYDALNLYPATTTDALSQSTADAYNYSNGKVATSTDPNGDITVNKYDGVGRVTEVDESNPSSPTSLVTKSTFAYTDSTSTPSLIHEADYLNSSTTKDIYDYYDGLDRLTQERKSTETSGTFAVTDRTYNLTGLLASESLPYFSSGSGDTTATSTSSLFATYAYDPLQRTSVTTNSVGSTANSYSKWTTTTTDPNGNVKNYTLDACGNLAQVVEHNTSSNATTTYAYNALNDLATTTDAAGNVRVFTHDGLSRLLSETDLHTAATTTYGTWTYSYDDQGNETSRADPKSQTITHTYDALNRMLTEAWTGHGTQITDTYDSCTNGIGRLCTASTSAALDSYGYDVLGDTTGATTTVQGTAYGLASTYDRQGNATSLTNSADGSELSYGYNAAGLVASVSRSIGATSTQLATLLNYAPTDELGNVDFASGASTTYSYAPSALYRLTNILTVGAATTTTAATSSLANNIASYWKFDEASGNPLDSAGSNNLTNNGSATFASGLINNAISLNGTSQYASAADTASLDPSSAFTACAWAYPTVSNSSATSPVFAKAYGSTWTSPYTSWMIRIDGPSPATIEADLAIGSSLTALNYSYTTTANTWYYLCEVYTGSSLILYLNGANVDSTSVSGSVGYNGGGLRVGNDTPGADYFQGKIDEMGLWSRALSASEISQLYASSTGLQYPFGAVGTSTRDIELQNASYTFDPNGNILSRTDKSDLANGQVTTYSYDPLNRLTSATANDGTLPTYTDAFTYDPLGNIQTGSDGTYTYGGSSGADPDAVTKISLTEGASAPTIGYDNSTIAGNGIPVSSLTFSYTVNSNTNSLIFIPVVEATTSPSCTSDKVTGVTDNGASLTDFGYYVRNTTTVGAALKTYYLFSPAQGTHNVVVSASASCILYAGAETITGAKQSGAPDASGTGNPLSDSGSVTVFQATTTTSNYNSWAFMIGVPSISGTATAGPNTTIRQQQSGYLYFGDSNGPVAPAGSIGLSWSLPSAANWIGNFFSLAPVVSNPGTTYVTNFSYDLNGNLTQAALQGSTSTLYAYDYLNRLASSTQNGEDTIFSYDALGNRVSEVTGNTTTIFPNKYYSLVTTTGSGTSTTATSTDFAFIPAQAGGNETLLATIDQPMVNGAASGTAVTRYSHPDNLGSTAVTSDQNGDLAASFDYAPYGSVLASSNTGTTTAARQFTGQFFDGNTNLIYDNARYYSPAQGQFLSQDPLFLAIGNQAQLRPFQQDQQKLLADPQGLNTSRTTGSASNLTFPSGSNGNTKLGSNSTSLWAEYLRDPQQQNAYGYSRDNPINYFDPTGDLGFFVNGSVGGDAGLGEGFSGQAGGGFGFTAGNSIYDPVDVGGYGSGGYLGGGPFGSATVEGVSGLNNSAVVGLDGGASAGLMFTNATRMSQLDGIGQTTNVNLGVGSVSWSNSNGIWTVTLDLGLKPAISFSSYPTETKTSTVVTVGNEHTACGTLCQ